MKSKLVIGSISMFLIGACSETAIGTGFGAPDISNIVEAAVPSSMKTAAL